MSDRSRLPGRRPRHDRPRNSRRWFEVAGLVVAVIGALAGVVAVVVDLSSHGGGGDPAPSPASLVTIGQKVVRNPPFATRDSGKAGASVQTDASRPTIDVTVKNGSRQRVLITQATFTILASTDLPDCAAQGGGGDVPVSADYTISLPYKPRPDELVVRQEMHRQIPADEVDRVAFHFGKLTGDVFDQGHLYAVKLSLTVDGRRTVDAGRYVLALPGAIGRAGVNLPEDTQIVAGITTWPNRRAVTWCLLRNVAEVDRLLSMPGDRSQELVALKGWVPAPNWEDDRDRAAPRVAVRELLADDDATLTTAMSTAVFAAQQTHDAAFETSVRRRAAARLLDEVRERLDSGWPQGALDSARTALQILETPEGAQLFKDAARRMANVKAEG